MKVIVIALAALLSSVAAHAGCGGPGSVIDMRSEAQFGTDLEAQRLRCVVFVLAGPLDRPRQGWVEWHHERAASIESTRIGLYSTGRTRDPAFGRLPTSAQAEPGAARLVVLLPTSYWLLVNTTRIGWQMRAGLVDDPGPAVRKLFTDVGLNAGLGDAARSLFGIADLARRPAR